MGRMLNRVIHFPSTLRKIVFWESFYSIFDAGFQNDFLRCHLAFCDFGRSRKWEELEGQELSQNDQKSRLLICYIG